MPEDTWNPVEQAKAKWPGLKDHSDAYILDQMADPKKFRSAFPEYSHLSDDVIKRNISALNKPHTTNEIRPLSEKEQLETVYPVGAKGETTFENVHNAARDAFTGAYGVVRHPIDTVTNLAKSVTPGFFPDVPNPIQATYQGLNTRPGETIAQGVGQAAILGPASKVAGRLVRGASRLPVKAGETMVRNATETTPRDVANVVKETSAKNEVEVEKATKKTEDARAKVADKNETARDAAKAKNAAQAEKRQVVLQKHFDALQKAKGEPGTSLESGRPRTPEELQSHKTALLRGVEQLDTPFKEDLTALKEKVNEEAHRRYGEQDAALNNEEATPHFLGDALDETADKIKNAGTNAPILKEMETRMNGSDPLTYEELQGYYSKLGKELSKKTLAGDVYYAYDTLQDLVGDEMQRIAKAKDASLAAAGEPPQNFSGKLAENRKFYRQMKQTFYDPKSPITRAIRATERGKSIAAFQGADQSGIAALAKYDPELAQRANTLRGYQAEAKGIPKAKQGTANRPPTLSPPPPPVEPKIIPEEPPVVPDTTTHTPESLSAVKAENVTKAAESMRHSKSPLVSAVAGYGTIKALLAKNLATAGMDILARVIYGAAKPMLADIIENPRVIAKLSKFTEKDAAAIAKLPAKQRAAFADTMGQVVDAAKQKGVKISPALMGAIAAAAHQNDSDRITEPPEP